jgi:ATP-dependent helicase IRC3
MLRVSATWLWKGPSTRATRLLPRAVPAAFRSASRKAKPIERPPRPPVPQVSLRNYQEECIQAVQSSLNNGHKRLGISLATGAGKTVIFTQLIDRIQAPAGHDGQTLILAHRRELVEQAARHCTTAYPHKTVDIEMGNLHASGTADITVASIQTIMSGDRICKFDPKCFKLVMVDEAHHIVSKEYLRALKYFGLDEKKDDSPILIGVSATLSRYDGLRLGAAIDEIVYHKDYVDMIGEKWLSDVIFTTVESTADTSRVRSSASGDFQPGELSRAVNTSQINDITVRTWLAKAQGRNSTLIFCVDVAHVTDLTQAFLNRGIQAKFVTGDTPKVERSKRLEAFKAGEFPVLLNCGVFTEGTDIPNIDCIILARPTRSRNLLIQMIGRGLRLHQGKTNCHIIDMVSTLETGIVTTPTLFGLDPGEVVSGASVADIQDIRNQREAKMEKSTRAESDKPQPEDDSRVRKLTFTEYDSVFDLIADTSGEKHIRSISPHAWVQVGPDKYILSSPQGTYLRLERDEDATGDEPAFAAWEIRALPAGAVSKSPFAAPRRLLQATTFADAVHGADKYAAEKLPHPYIARRMRWRSGPATAGQLKLLNRLRAADDQLSPEDVSMGKASDMITKLKHGAKGRYAELDSGRRKRQRQAAKIEQQKERQAREKVTVGPVTR